MIKKKILVLLLILPFMLFATSSDALAGSGEGVVQKQEYIQNLVKCLELDVPPSVMKPPFVGMDPDFAPYIKAAVRDGLITEREILKPEETITRQEALIFMGRAFVEKPYDAGVLGNFKDAHEIDDEAIRFFARAVSAGFLVGYPDYTLRPEQSLSREEKGLFLERLFYLRQAQEIVDCITLRL